MSQEQPPANYILNEPVRYTHICIRCTKDTRNTHEVMLSYLIWVSIVITKVNEHTGTLALEEIQRPAQVRDMLMRITDDP